MSEYDRPLTGTELDVERIKACFSEVSGMAEDAHTALHHKLNHQFDLSFEIIAGLLSDYGEVDDEEIIARIKQELLAAQ
ncbi:hypothetical protein [Aliagarivorans taiwanensis]|uniref:hypothetical protein n=1 Tax=Aliagarivorans taiwanensis TaxID=561966 RepID=UPI0004002247|nr:hypothetical protein [Aliagarivorans taiwanensis]